MSNRILMIALAAALIGCAAAYAAGSAARTVETEVRITAQRLTNGRIEFALQQRNKDGEWGEHLLPQRRFFPAEGYIERWANSTPVSLGVDIEEPPLYINNTQPTESLTVEQYLETCSEPGNVYADALQKVAEIVRTSDDDPGSVSWGQFFDLTDSALTLLQSIEPPPDLREYHRAQVSGFTTFVQYAHLKPSGEVFAPLELFIPAIVTQSMIEEAQDNLDPQLRDQLIEAGCLDESAAAANPESAEGTEHSEGPESSSEDP